MTCGAFVLRLSYRRLIDEIEGGPGTLLIARPQQKHREARCKSLAAVREGQKLPNTSIAPQLRAHIRAPNHAEDHLMALAQYGTRAGTADAR
jgi:hypothetical protein